MEASGVNFFVTWDGDGGNLRNIGRFSTKQIQGKTFLEVSDRRL